MIDPNSLICSKTSKVPENAMKINFVYYKRLLFFMKLLYFFLNKLYYYLGFDSRVGHSWAFSVFRIFFSTQSRLVPIIIIWK